MELAGFLEPFPRLVEFLLLLLRVSALIIASPLFGRVNIPRMTKVGFCVFLTYMFFVAYPTEVVLDDVTLFSFAGICLKELLFGLILGFCTNLFFTLVFTSGQMIDMQIGFGMVNVLDPQSNMQVPVTGNILNLLLLICFFAVNGHHRLFTVIISSMQGIPVGQAVFQPALMARAALEAFSLAFLLAIQVAMPVIAGAVALEVVLGIMIRTVPQLNMFVAGLPLKVLLGLILFFLMMQPYVRMSNVIFSEMFDSIRAMLEGLMPQ